MVKGLKFKPCLLKLLSSVRQLLDQASRATLRNVKIRNFFECGDDVNEHKILIILTAVTVMIMIRPAAQLWAKIKMMMNTIKMILMMTAMMTDQAGCVTLSNEDDSNDDDSNR